MTGELLERAIGYTLGTLRLVTPEALGAPTPCRDWDLRTLLAHLDDSLIALHEATETGHVDLCVSEQDSARPDLAGTVRNRARRLLGASAIVDGQAAVSVAGHALATDVVTFAGALEIVVHGWDVARACGHCRPIPAPLAGELLPMLSVIVSEDDRPSRFGAALDVAPLAEPGDRLLAFVGRRA